MKCTKLILEKKDGVAKIVLNQPEKLNCLDKEGWLELRATLVDIDKDDKVKVAIITGKGRAFCTGSDLKDVIAMPRRQDVLFEYLSLVRSVYTTIEEMSKPVIAAVNGPALAGGFELVLACDIVIASADARIGDQHINYGLLGLSIQMLPRLIGMRKARELLFTGDWLSAAEAEKIGLVNKVVSADKLEEAADELAAKLASKSSQAIKFTKTLLRLGMQTDRDTAERLGLEMITRYGFSSGDPVEGLEAFKGRN